MSDSKSGVTPLWRCVTVSVVAVVCAFAIWVYFPSSPATDYVPLVLLFLSAVAAIRGKSWDENRHGFARVTLTGLIIFVLAFLGLVAGIRTSQQKLAEVEQFRAIAYNQLMEGISMILFPITSSWRESALNDAEILDKALDPTTVDDLSKTRLVPFTDQVENFMAALSDTRFHLITARGIRVASTCGSPHPGFRALYELFDFCVANGEERLTQTKQMYLGKLDLKTIQLIDAILKDEFFMSRYRNLAQHEDLYYQGLWDEIGDVPATADRTWIALVELTGLGKDTDDTRNRDGYPSSWLYLGTYYFDNDLDSSTYQAFIRKVGAFVKHVGDILEREDLIDTFDGGT